MKENIIPEKGIILTDKEKKFYIEFLKILPRVARAKFNLEEKEKEDYSLKLKEKLDCLKEKNLLDLFEKFKKKSYDESLKNQDKDVLDFNLASAMIEVSENEK